MSARKLSTAERQQAWRVFGPTIPYDKIALTGSSGMDDRPYTTPNPWPWDWESWDIHWGTQEEWNRKMSAMGGPWYYWATLIHEARNRLNAISLWNSVLRKQVRGAAVSQEALDTIERNVKLLAQVLEQVTRRD